MLDTWYLDNLVCPVDRTKLRLEGETLVSEGGRRYPVIDGMPVMLVSDERQTIGVARASLDRANGKTEVIDQRAPHFYLESLGVSDEEKDQLLAIAARGDARVDPVVSVIIGATSGYAYLHLLGDTGMADYPIPDIRLPDPKPGATLLDIGCNWGRWSIAAARKGYSVVGLDPQLGACMAARRITRQMGLTDVRFVVADGRFPPFADNSFDSVYSYSVIQHLSREDAETVFAAVGRVLKSGGLAAIQMAGAFGIRSLQHQARRGFREAENFDVRYWSAGQLARVFRKHIGPTKVRTDCYFGLGWQWSDFRHMTGKHKPILLTSEVLRRISDVVAPMRQVADSLFCFAVKP